MTPGTIIDELGGTAAVAAGLGLDDSTVSKWRERGIPPGRWLALVGLAERKELWALAGQILRSGKASSAEVRA